MWKFQRGSQMWLGGNSSQIKTLPKADGTRDPRIWKLQPATADAGFLIVYKDGSNDRFVPRWADLENALLLSGSEPDNFKQANEITSVFVIPDVIGRVESDKGFLFEDEDNYRVYLYPYRQWATTKEWVPANDESSWMGNPNEQYLRKLLDNYETSGTIRGGKVVTDGTAGPSAWVWNSASPRRWRNINLSGSEWAVVLDQEGEQRIEKYLGEQDYFHAAINRKAFPN